MVPILIMTFLLLVTSCVGGLSKLAVGDVRGYRSERFTLGSAEGTLGVSMYQGGKKKITFESGRLEVIFNSKTLAVATLRQPVEVRPGWQVAELPLRIRFGRDGVGKALDMLLPRRERDCRQPEIRVAVTLEVRSGDGSRAKTIRFKRKLTDAQWQEIGQRFGGLFSVGNLF